MMNKLTSQKAKIYSCAGPGRQLTYLNSNFNIIQILSIVIVDAFIVYF